MSPGLSKLILLLDTTVEKLLTAYIAWETLYLWLLGFEKVKQGK